MMKSFLWVCLAVMFLSSCARTPPVKQYFFNNIQVHQTGLKSKTDQVLLVSLLIAVTAFQGKDMLYVHEPYQLASFSRHTWIASPDDMLATLLVQSLQNTGYFYAVVSSPYVGSADLRLDSIDCFVSNV